MFLISGLWFSAQPGWFSVLGGEPSSAALLLSLQPFCSTLLWTVTHLPQYVACSSGDLAENCSAAFWHNCFILCAVQNSDEFSTSSAPCAASESVKGNFFLLVFTPFKERWFLHMHIEQSAEEDEVEGGARNVWLTSKCGQKSPVIYITVDPRALLLVAQGCFAVWLLRLKSSTPSKSALKRLIFKWWEWRGRFDYGCLYKPVGWSTGPPFPLMCLSSLVQKCFGKVWKQQRSLLTAASLTDACRLLRVLQ